MTQTPTPPPESGLSKGLRSALAVAAIAGASAVVATFLIQPATERTAGNASAVRAGSSLAASIISFDPVNSGPEMITETGSLRSRDTLIDLLARLGADHQQAYAALNVLYDAKLIDPHRLRPGLTATVHLSSDDGRHTLEAISINAASDYNLFVKRSSDGTYQASRLNAVMRPEYNRVAGVIDTSIYDMALAHGAGDQQVVDLLGNHRP